MSPLERFAANLREARLRRGLSQEALADLCDLHRTEVSLLERAQREPRLTTIVRLARALELPPAELLSGPRPDADGDEHDRASGSRPVGE
jgi:transcriptional regulator with XRE-family HTH domain